MPPTRDPILKRKIRFALVGCGRIAGRIVRTVGVRLVDTPGTTRRFAFTPGPPAPGRSRQALPGELVSGEHRALAADALRNA